MFKKKLFAIGGSLLLSASFAAAQDTTKTTTTTTTSKTDVVQNADGTYTVIEYPVGKEVMVNLTPATNMMGGKGMARIMRMGDMTNVNLDLSGLPADASNYYVYAVDPMGKVTLLGPANISGGMSKVNFTTPMDKFMLVLSPNEGLNTIGNDTPVTFRSAVPQGFAVVPTAVTGTTMSGKVDKAVGVSVPVASAYDVPLLGVQSFSGKTTELRFNFAGDMQGLKGKAYIKPRKDGTAQIKLRFQGLANVTKNTRYIVWLVSGDKQYTKLGQFINAGAKNEAEVRGETALKDFGMFVTAETAEVNAPTGTIFTTFTVGR
ncbi:MAG: hypothetical protein H0U87_10485 [Acidobacteria bacterium]|jgi:hypothetical protein|nr:hypothetical protein [Acidobacteriota bacterium]